MPHLELPLLVLTGAGVSRESGVPTFRDPDGFWQNHRVEDLATPEAFARDPVRVWEWYDWRRQQIASCRPNAAHEAIRGMEMAAPPGEFLLATQNVDGLHEAAGSQAVVRLHGSIWELACTGCPHRAEDRRAPLEPLPPRCPICGALLRPGVVWFGEPLDPDGLGRAFRAARAARTVIVVGTSALVYPAALLPETALDHGAYVVEANPEETPLSRLAHERLIGPAARLLPAWWAEHGLG